MRPTLSHMASHLLVTFVLFFPASAHSYELLEDYHWVYFYGCNEDVRWTRDPVFMIRQEFLPPVGRQAALPAVRDVIQSVADVDGSWISPQLGVDERGGLLPHIWDGQNDIYYLPRIEILRDFIPPDLKGLALVLAHTGECKIIGADLLVTVSPFWEYDGPRERGETYHDAGVCAGGQADGEGCGAAPESADFFRTVLLHELLHGMGLAHNSEQYSYLNYGRFPWSSNPLATQIEPLPDDRLALRDVYSGPGAERDVAVLSTWLDHDDVFDDGGPGAARQKLLCRPSAGANIDPDPFAEECGISVDDDPVCPGDRVFLRYALANYGTADERVREELWFRGSSFVVPVRSLDSYASDLVASTSELRERSFTVPALPTHSPFGGSYWLEIRAVTEGAPAEESLANNEMPQGRVRIASALECGRTLDVDWPPVPPQPWDFEVHDCDDPMAAGIPICP